MTTAIESALQVRSPVDDAQRERNHMRRSVLRDNSSLFDIGLRIVDPLYVIGAGVVAHIVYFGNVDLPVRYVTALLGVALIALAAFAATGLYRSQRGVSFVDETRTLCIAWLAIAVSSGLFLFLSKTGADFSRAWALIWMVGGLFGHILLRATIRLALRAMRKTGTQPAPRRHRRGRRTRTQRGARIRAAPWSGMSVRAFYDDDAAPGGVVDGIPVAGPIAQLTADADERPTDQVWIALPLRDEAPHPRRRRGTAADVRDHPLRPGHLRLPPAQSFGHGGCRHAGTESHRLAAFGRLPNIEVHRGLRARDRQCW